MSNSLRILTYNTQMRSWGMEVLAQNDLFPVDSTEARAKTISRRILESPEEYDIVCFNEVFDEDAREVFKNELSGRYPNIVIKADVDNVVLQIGLVAGGALGGAITLLAIPVLGWLAAAGIAVAAVQALMETKFEDSGLMIFSRLPFATIPLSKEMKAIVEPLGFSESDFPIIQYVPYAASASQDAMAAKGVVYARFIRDDGRPLHLLASHTQADATVSPGKFAAEREKQLEEVWGLIDRMVGPPPFDDEIVFCGDLNIDGCFHGSNIVVADAVSVEWRDRFRSGGSNFTTFLHDTWFYEQCPGFNPGGTTLLPDFFDRGITSYNMNRERLDYFFRPIPFPDRLATQHIAIAWEIAREGNPAFPATSYTSDHLPLRLDLNLDRPRASLVRAEQIFAHPDIDVLGQLTDGQMDWIRIDEPGAYGLRLVVGEARVSFVMYGASDLSSPLPPFSVTGDQAGDNPFGTRFVLPDPPYLIRVFLKDRHSETNYKLHVHKFEGTSQFDAIPLLFNVPTDGEARQGAPHSLDQANTQWSEHDSVWFCFQLDNDDQSPIDAKATFTIRDADQHAFGILVLSRDSGGSLKEIGAAPPGDPTSTAVNYTRARGGLVLAQRRGDNPPFSAQHFKILLANNLNYIYPKVPQSKDDLKNLGMIEATIFCKDETDGIGGNEWGSDDISFNLSADGKLVVHADNDDDLEFDDDTQRQISRWIDKVVRYVNNAEFELVELDDLSPVDRTSITIPPFDMLLRDNPPEAGHPADMGVFTFRLVFDNDDGDEDGVYYLFLTISCRPPPQSP